MPATADQLRAIENSFSMGSEGRYRHGLNGNFIFTEGMKTMADAAGCYWLIDIMATECYAECFKRARANAALVMEVKEGAALLEMEFTYPYHEDKWTKVIDATDFPEGHWVFSLEWDGIIAFPKTVLVGLLMAEH